MPNYQTKKSECTTAIFQDSWNTNEIKADYEDKLKVDDVAYKYRVYYKTIWNDSANPNLLTFIMLNPSTANQYSNDPSVNNCIKVAKKYKEYDGIEVLNVYSLRHPVFSEIEYYIKNGKGNPDNIDYGFAQCRNIVLAWGDKKVTLDKNMSDKIKEAEHLYILGAGDPSLIKKDFVVNYNKNKLNQMRHPDNRAWTRLGGITNAKLFEIDKKRYIDNDEIIRQG